MGLSQVILLTNMLGHVSLSMKSKPLHAKENGQPVLDEKELDPVLIQSSVGIVEFIPGRKCPAIDNISLLWPIHHNRNMDLPDHWRKKHIKLLLFSIKFR